MHKCMSVLHVFGASYSCNMADIYECTNIYVGDWVLIFFVNINNLLIEKICCVGVFQITSTCVNCNNINKFLSMVFVITSTLIGTIGGCFVLKNSITGCHCAVLIVIINKLSYGGPTVVDLKNDTWCFSNNIINTKSPFLDENPTRKHQQKVL